ncbi:DEAD/DEAH box helicase [Bacillus shivajii]|uniref:DNA repair helicase XPB n=1 Tax=Bacillus shivajii TaxID=1983719 RepID=UPI001CFA8D4C|nr:DNA repair helicase XPB [Bacillus shivajii]UCZ51852.1 DEAD/DEAH box helicase [Bacillus shivajii]
MEQKPLYIQENGMVYFNTAHREAKIVQPFLSQFAHLTQSPSEIHIYQLSQYSVWYAFDQAITSEEIISFLTSFSNPPFPSKVIKQLQDWENYNHKLFIMEIEGHGTCLYSEIRDLLAEVFPENQMTIFHYKTGEAFPITLNERGIIKQRMLKLGYPVIDCLKVEEGERLGIQLEKDVQLRPYQIEAVNSYLKPNGYEKGNGFVIMPCGSGKTLVGIGVMTKLDQETLIIAPNDTSLSQWENEIMTCTTIDRKKLKTYSSSLKEVGPITLTTYQMLTYKGKEPNLYPHFNLFQERKWGLIIYDEVHLLPAPLFRLTSFMQGKRRLGLTATFIREDGREDDIYSLIGPKRYEVGIKELEHKHWVAKPVCKEYKIPFREDQWENYLQSSKKEQFKLASENDEKLHVIDMLLKKHSHDQILIIGQYKKQLKKIADYFSIPIITGETKKSVRENIYDDFRSGQIQALVVSKVANMAVNLPSANVAIQVSGVYGSRQEEAQRIGRVLRPNTAEKLVYFYSLVTSLTQEEERASNRQLFMKEQGYQYEEEEWSRCSDIN